MLTTHEALYAISPPTRERRKKNNIALILFFSTPHLYKKNLAQTVCSNRRNAAPQITMQFLCEQLSVSLTESSKTDTFVVDVFQPRPDCKQLEAFQKWSTEARADMQAAMRRKNCAVAWAAIVIDEVGMLAVVRLRKAAQLCHAKSAANQLRQQPQYHWPAKSAA